MSVYPPKEKDLPHDSHVCLPVCLGFWGFFSRHFFPLFSYVWNLRTLFCKVFLKGQPSSYLCKGPLLCELVRRSCELVRHESVRHGYKLDGPTSMDPQSTPTEQTLTTTEAVAPLRNTILWHYMSNNTTNQLRNPPNTILKQTNQRLKFHTQLIICVIISNSHGDMVPPKWKPQWWSSCVRAVNLISDRYHVCTITLWSTDLISKQVQLPGPYAS